MAVAAVWKARRRSRALNYLENAYRLSKLANALISDQDGPRTPSSTALPTSNISSNPPPIFMRRVVVKDNIATSSFETTCGSHFLENYKSPFAASLFKKFLDFGKFSLKVKAKSNMDEFGMGSHSMNSYFGQVHNVKRYSELSAGGSSGGSAVAVATGYAAIALGTDTGGSVRLPAAYTGIVGFKPSYGMISRHGVVPYANSLDTVGIFAKDCRLVDKALPYFMDYDANDPTSATNNSRRRYRHRSHAVARRAGGWWSNNARIRIGVPIEYHIKELQGPVWHTWARVLNDLQNIGYEIVPVSLPSTKQALSAYYVLAAAEAASNLAKYDGVRYGMRNCESDGDGGVLYASTRGKGFGDEVKRRILLGSYTLSSEAINNYFIQAQKVRRLVQRDFDRVFAAPNPLRPKEQFDLSDINEAVALENKLGPAQVDVLVCPTAPTLPPRLKDVAKATPVDAYMNDVFTVPASLAGLPALSVPVSISKGFREEGDVPFAGIQVIGQYWCDYLVLKVGQVIEGSLKPEVEKSMAKEE